MEPWTRSICSALLESARIGWLLSAKGRTLAIYVQYTSFLIALTKAVTNKYAALS